MKIVNENLGFDKFIEISLTPKDLEHLQDYMILSKRHEVKGDEFNFGVRLQLNEYEEDDDDYF